MRLPSEAFSADAVEGRITLVGYLPAGYPGEKDYLAAAKEMSAAGFRILEIGIPPAAAGLDGRIIEEAMSTVGRAGMDLQTALALGADAASAYGMAAVGLLYYECLRASGTSRTLELFASSAVRAILVPDMPAEEWAGYAQEAVRLGIEPVGFIPPGADRDGVARIAASARGFLYVPSYAGKTGSSFGMNEALQERFSMIKSAAARSGLPVAVGFGLRNAKDIEAVRALGANGAVVGTALVEAAGKGAEALKDLLRRMTAGRGSPAWKS